MKICLLFFAMLFLAGVALAQDSGQDPKSSTNDPNLAAEVETLREALLPNSEAVGRSTARN